jgi:hypothetical protein
MVRVPPTKESTASQALHIALETIWFFNGTRFFFLLFQTFTALLRQMSKVEVNGFSSLFVHILRPSVMEQISLSQEEKTYHSEEEKIVVFVPGNGMPPTSSPAPGKKLKGWRERGNGEQNSKVFL